MDLRLSGKPEFLNFPPHRIRADATLAVCIAVCVFIVSFRAAAEIKPLDGWELPPAEKVKAFEKQLHETHDIDGMILADLEIIRNPDGTESTLPWFDDTDYWTGNYLVGESLRYALTKNPEAKANCERSVRALIRNTRVTGVRGLLVRGYMEASMSGRYRLVETELVHLTPDGSMYISLDASADQLIGAMQGFHFVYRYVADEQLKKEIAEAVSDVCDYIIKNNYKIIDVTGKPTTWGVFTPGYIPSDLHAFLILTVFKIAAYVTGNQGYEEVYRTLREKESYGVRSRTAKFPSIQNSSDDAMEFVCYLNMLMIETDSAARADYLASMRRTWKYIRYHDKSYINFIVLYYIDDLPDREEVLRRSLNQINIFPTDKVMKTVDYCTYERPDRRYPNPANFRPVENSYWTGDVFTCSYNAEPGRTMIAAGVDYILVYWLGRFWGYISE